jgi:NADH-quinone oxidoreductase E subunit
VRLAPEHEKRAHDLMALYPQRRSALLPLLHLLQEQDGHLTEDGMEHIGELVGLLPAEVLSVASFYDMFKLEPVGRYVLGICTNIACLLDGAEELLHHAEERLGVKDGGTTPDGLFTLEEVECVAHCNFAPCLQANYRYFGPLTNDDFDTLVDDLGSGRLKDLVPPHGTLVRVRRDGGLKVAPERIVEERRIVAGQIADRAAGEEATKKAAEERDAKAKAEAEKVEKETVEPPKGGPAGSGGDEKKSPEQDKVVSAGDAEEGQDAERSAKQAAPGTADVERKRRRRRKKDT